MSNTKTRRLSVVLTPTHPLRLEPGEVVHIGVDVHKVSSSVALYSDGRRLLVTWAQPAWGRKGGGPEHRLSPPPEICGTSLVGPDQSLVLLLGVCGRTVETS